MYVEPMIAQVQSEDATLYTNDVETHWDSVYCI